MLGHGILILVSVYLPPKKKLFRSNLEASFGLEDAVILFDDFNSALTDHIRTVVENSSRTIPVTSNRRELPRNVSELIRVKNAALRRAGKYPTCENRSHACAHQRKVKASMKEVRNENWSDLMAGISFSHKAYWVLAKVVKAEGAVPTSTLKRPDNSIAFDDREKAECLADSIEHQCIDNPPYDLEHVSKRRLENTYSSIRPIRAGVPQGSMLSPLLYSVYVSDMTRLSTGNQIALFADDTALYLRSNSIENILPSLQRAIDELTQ
ncbi:RNA-directed DNA polymerase from mobile element jockey [Eumeta japonica]|uniref:RNA-directed DNA polymerase from mobile element jockey n=1 Tax=Eumeta variegata TaxID=151549 RepID=A0A4C1YK09_EUMVA|nr:RNA-directed DNA polymerase from mobile element jockey [Eumeta japonica]